MTCTRCGNSYNDDPIFKTCPDCRRPIVLDGKIRLGCTRWAKVGGVGHARDDRVDNPYQQNALRDWEDRN
jgi:hypothetical protein